MTASSDSHDRAIRDVVEGEFRREVPEAVSRLAQRLAQRAAGGAVAVLFYGSALRDGALDGVLDFYVLLDRASAWPGSNAATLANRILPPNVAYTEETIDGQVLRAKCAVMTLSRFRRAMSPNALDTTLWARFSQPCACVHARSPADRAVVREVVVRAVITAASWAAALGPARADALDYWRCLYARTFELELRVERSSRSDAVVGDAPERYACLLAPAWRAVDIDFEQAADGGLRPLLDLQARRRASRRWTLRRRIGRPLNILRLLKAAFTFEGAMEYVAWKVERHSGVRLEVAPWQRRFPLLAAPGLYWRLRRRGVLR